MGITTFVGRAAGPWRVLRMAAVAGPGLDAVERLSVVEDGPPPPSTWRLRSFGSNHRYTTRAELDALNRTQPGLGRPEATCAGHNAIGLDYLPGVARRLLHCRDLGEPRDFLTWFEFAPGDAPAFDALLRRLRGTPEWAYVEREVEIRLER